MTTTAPNRAIILSALKRGGDLMARRRGQRKGYIFAKGPSWIVQWREDIRASDGTIGRHKFSRVIAIAKGPGAISKRQAQRAAWEQVLSKLDDLSLRPQSLYTVEEFVRMRFQPDVVLKCKSTSSHYPNMLRNHVLPALGEMRLRDVRLEDVQELLSAKLAAGLSVQTAVHIRNTVTAIFNHAKRHGHYSGDVPTSGVQLPDMIRPERRILTPAQVKEIYRALPSPLRELILLLAITGLRIGEACGLRWKRLNWSDEFVVVGGEPVPPRTIAVVEAYVRGTWTTVKKEASERHIPLPRPLAAALLGLKRSTRWNGPDNPVFASRNGTPIDQHNIARRKLKPIVKELGIPWASWHSFRHTLASLADQAGMTLTERRRVLGHAGDRMTLHYSHADLERVREGLESIAALIIDEPGRLVQ